MSSLVLVYRDKWQSSGCQEREGWTTKDMRNLLQMMEMFYILFVSDSFTEINNYHISVIHLSSLLYLKSQ